MKLSHIMYTSKILTDLCFTKQKQKKYFCKSCLQCFSGENVLNNHKEVCLSINGAESETLEKGTTELKISSKKYKFHLKFILILSVF